MQGVLYGECDTAAGFTQIGLQRYVVYTFNIYHDLHNANCSSRNAFELEYCELFGKFHSI